MKRASALASSLLAWTASTAAAQSAHGYRGIGTDMRMVREAGEHPVDRDALFLVAAIAIAFLVMVLVEVVGHARRREALPKKPGRPR